MQHNPYPRVTANEKVRAGDLSAEHIGKRIQFNYVFQPSKVGAIVFGELREVHHHGEGTTLWLSRSAAGDKQEFDLSPNQSTGVRDSRWKEL
ncbi:hypothetical protein SEA_SERENITY_73 [Mycobacterium phage Serenity]|uniref:hypothetical protein n=1 Tax=Mycobacterium phage Serenity TaxID=1701853 RepID=UPI0006CE3688|nr:hypothetical protein SEA_SERENITY_73 [Mycobacterium phage Serenity]ALF00940.1 hypothetical protein SEA_SERENITY_73 [Mycobacterium phage Serenity]